MTTNHTAAINSAIEHGTEAGQTWAEESLQSLTEECAAIGEEPSPAAIESLRAGLNPSGWSEALVNAMGSAYVEQMAGGVDLRTWLAAYDRAAQQAAEETIASAAFVDPPKKERTNASIYSLDGNELSAGLQVSRQCDEAIRAAERHADRLCEDVLLHDDDGEWVVHPRADDGTRDPADPYPFDVDDDSAEVAS